MPTSGCFTGCAIGLFLSGCNNGFEQQPQSHVAGLQGHFIALQNHFTGLQGHFIALQNHFTGLQGHFIGLQGHLSVLQNHSIVPQSHFTGLQNDFIRPQSHFIALQDDLGIHAIDRQDDALLKALNSAASGGWLSWVNTKRCTPAACSF